MTNEVPKINHSPDKMPVARVSEKIRQKAKAASDRHSFSDQLACSIVKEIVPLEFRPDLNQDFFQKVSGGRFSPEQLCLRDQILAPGVNVRRDIGVTFYRVQKGDTLIKIKQKLVALPEFAYLAKLHASSIKSFNIPPKYLQLGMLIPIPPEDSPSRNLNDTAFVAICRDVLVDMRKDPVYGKRIRLLLLQTSQSELLALMLAVAKSECGGKIAQFSTSRYEKDHKVFSYSVFHVLMEGAGLTARKKLNLSEGQLEHPRNAAKLFLAFMIEKSGKRLGKQFPLEDHYDDFATFYNGSAWPKFNPNYPIKLKDYYEQALKLIKA